MEVPAPTGEVLQTVLHRTITRMMKLLTREKVLLEDQGRTRMAEPARWVWLVKADAMAHRVRLALPP
jgi:hypothetical protein